MTVFQSVRYRAECPMCAGVGESCKMCDGTGQLMIERRAPQKAVQQVKRAVRSLGPSHRVGKMIEVVDDKQDYVDEDDQ